MSTTLRDLMRFTMPPASRLLTGDDGLQVQVRGIAGLRATLPAFPELRGGELALVSPTQALALDERLTLPHIITRLAEVPVAAIAVAGMIGDAQATALQADLPLIELPPDTDLRTVERDAMRLLMDPDLQIERWASQLYSQLTQRVVDGAGVSGVLARLAESTGLDAACYTPGGKLRAQHAQGAARSVFEILRPDTAGEHHLLGQHVYVTQISDAGWLALAGSALDPWDQLAARQGAAALALELAKEQAVKDAEARVRGDLVRTILSGTPVDMESINSQAVELGYKLDQPHIALVIASAAGDQPATLQPVIERLLNQRKLTAPLLLREDSVLVFLPVTSNPAGAHTLLDPLRESHPIAAGISATAPTAAHWAHALDEAEQA
ncbi:MAG TPA: PucR family transcriptional regulator ligand-binding domain-containing protein, partial [Herpetosiphonaceae bacterium]|nr:PucR family transcriptional regulator ligand-binding domain-containing protein [Herpetosiphonaceae bacterium]